MLMTTALDCGTPQRVSSTTVTLDIDGIAVSVPEGTSVLKQRARLVRSALSCLSAEQREVIELAYFEGLTHVEIAERIKQPLGTAKSRIRLGMVKLRDALTPEQQGWSM